MAFLTPTVLNQHSHSGYCMFQSSSVPSVPPSPVFQVASEAVYPAWPSCTTQLLGLQMRMTALLAIWHALNESTTEFPRTRARLRWKKNSSETSKSPPPGRCSGWHSQAISLKSQNSDDEKKLKEHQKFLSLIAQAEADGEQLQDWIKRYRQENSDNLQQLRSENG